MNMRKKLSTMLVALMLAASMTGTIASAAVADDTTPNEQPTASIVIKNNLTTTGIDLKDKSFGVYKVFDATVNNDAVGDAHISYVLADDFKNFFFNPVNPEKESYGGGFGLGMNADDESAVEAYIHQIAEDKALPVLASKFNEYVKTDSLEKITTITGTVEGSTDQAMVSTALTPGYYLVLDESTNGSTISAAMLVSLPAKDDSQDFTQNAEVDLKGSQPDIDKDIYHNDKGQWDSVGDYDIGDVVDFRITCEIPKDISTYEHYEYIVTDIMSKGIKFNQGSLKVCMNDDKDSDPVEGNHHTATIFGADDELKRTWEIDFDMLAIKDKFKDLDKFYIFYTGTVTEDAVIHKDGVSPDYENNKVTLDFSNNPYDEKSKGKAEDTVYGYSFKLNFKKTDTSKVNPLANAVFALWANPMDETKSPYQIYLKQDATDPTIYYVQNQDDVATNDKLVCDEETKAGHIVTDNTGLFTIRGLDDAFTYTLKEVKAPDGYTAGDDINFTINADYGTDGGTIPTVTISNDKFTPDEDGVLGTIIVNTSSELFPGTGGVGTTLFVIGGCSVMGAAGLMLILSRKKSQAK